MIKLGSRVMDKVTGFEGITTGYCTYLYGCNQYNIVSQVKDGKPSEVFWYDDGRVEFIDDGINAEDVKGTKNGGPQRESPGRQG